MGEGDKPAGTAEQHTNSDSSTETASSSALRRRVLLKRAAISSFIGSALLSESTRAGNHLIYTIKQGDEKYNISPLSYKDQTIHEFYGYSEDKSRSNTSTGIENPDTSQLFFYRGPEKTNLAVLHDAHGLPQYGSEKLPIYDRFTDGNLSEWTTKTSGDAGVEVMSERLRLRVYKCSKAVAERDLGRVKGDLTISFDWEYLAEEWYELTEWEIVDDDGNPVEYKILEGTDLPRHLGYSGHQAGSVKVKASVQDNLKLRFKIVPSDYCSFPDHANTYLWIDNLRVQEGTGGEAAFEFDQLPPKGSWVIQDDPTAFSSSVDTNPEWKWIEGETDGGALEGDFKNFQTTITPTFKYGIDNLQFLTGDAQSPDRIELEKNQPITVKVTHRRSSSKGKGESSTKRGKGKQNWVSAGVLIPTRVQKKGEEEVPVIKKAIGDCPRSWQIQEAGKKCDYAPGVFGCNSLPDWVEYVVSDDYEPLTSGVYMRIPCSLVISTSIDTNKPIFQDFNYTQGACEAVLGIDDRNLPTNGLPPGMYEFGLVLHLSTTSVRGTEFINNYGAPTVELGVEPSAPSKITKALTRSSNPYLKSGNEIQFSTGIPSGADHPITYGAIDTYKEDLIRALKIAYRNLKRLHEIASIAYTTPIELAAEGVEYTARKLIWATSKELLKNNPQLANMFLGDRMIPSHFDIPTNKYEALFELYELALHAHLKNGKEIEISNQKSLRQKAKYFASTLLATRKIDGTYYGFSGPFMRVKL